MSVTFVTKEKLLASNFRTLQEMVNELCDYFDPTENLSVQFTEWTQQLHGQPDSHVLVHTDKPLVQAQR